MATSTQAYPATLDVDYNDKSDRFTVAVRFIWAIPIVVIASLLSASGNGHVAHEAGKEISGSGPGIVGGLFCATALMIVFRQRYPKWWFDFALELSRFSTRVAAYVLLLTDTYPSTVDKQSVHLEVKYPNVKKDLNKWLPLVKWFLAIPHYIVLIVLMVGAILATIVAWFTILFTGTYPKNLFDYVVGVGRWSLRVYSYAFLLVTDEYPPFSLD